MNSIEINSENLSRFNKRLQKAVEEQMGQKIKLADASTLFAKTLGKNSEHELQQVLKNSHSDNSNKLSNLQMEMKNLQEKINTETIKDLQALMSETELECVEVYMLNTSKDWEENEVTGVALSFHKNEGGYFAIHDGIYEGICEEGYNLQKFMENNIVRNNSYHEEIYEKLSKYSQEEIKKLKDIISFVQKHSDIFVNMKRGAEEIYVEKKNFTIF